VSNQSYLPSTTINIKCTEPITGRYVYFVNRFDLPLSLCEVVWSSACALCPENSLSLPGSVAVGACRCNAGWTGPDGGACGQCVANTFKAEAGSATCKACLSSILQELKQVKSIEKNSVEHRVGAPLPSADSERV